MTHITAIKSGINTVNKNWHLLVVQLASLLLSGLSFFIIVGIPIAIAFILFGLDLTEILRLKDLVSVFRGSAELLNKYFAMALIILFSLIIYLLFVIVVWIYSLGGTIAILARSALKEISRFSLKIFFAEGRRLFMPLAMFSSLIGLLFIVIAFFLGILVGGASSVIDIAKSYDATFGLFISFFFSLVLMSVGIVLILPALSAAAFGIAELAFYRSGSLAAIKQSVRYLYSRPSAIGFYTVLLLGYMAIGFIVILMGAPLPFIPIIGPVITLPYQLVTYIIQGYLSLVMLASIMHYYKATAADVPRLSTRADGTSPQTGPGPVPLPGPMEETSKD